MDMAYTQNSHTGNHSHPHQRRNHEKQTAKIISCNRYCPIGPGGMVRVNTIFGGLIRRHSGRTLFIFISDKNRYNKTSIGHAQQIGQTRLTVPRSKTWMVTTWPQAGFGHFRWRVMVPYTLFSGFPSWLQTRQTIRPRTGPTRPGDCTCHPRDNPILIHYPLFPCMTNQ